MSNNPPNEDDVISAWQKAAKNFGTVYTAPDDSNDVFIGPDNVQQFASVSEPGEIKSDKREPAPAASEPPSVSEAPISRLPAKDRARLLNNRSIDATTYVSACGERFAILHLTLRDLESFQAAVADLEEVLTECLRYEGPIERYFINERERLAGLFYENIPTAAALALRIDRTEAMLRSNPLELLLVVIAQWKHNAEITSLREKFPYPPDDGRRYSDQELGILDDPNVENPLAVIDGLCQSYHWNYDDALDRTAPQCYLLGLSSAWSNYRMRLEMDKDAQNPERRNTIRQGPAQRDGKVYFEGEWWELKKMPRSVYRRYLAENLSRPYAGLR